MYFHGMPGCRVEVALFDAAAVTAQYGIRLIVPDRPGVGRTPFQPDRHICDWPDDVLALAGHLDIDRFAVMAVSAGCPYGLACARAIPDRLTAVTIVAGESPHDVPGVLDGMSDTDRQFFALAATNPRMLRIVLRMMRLTAKFLPNRFLAQVRSTLPPPDRAVLARPHIQQVFRQLMLEMGRQGPSGPALDTTLLVRPWGFALDEISVPVSFWQGDLDQNAPPAMARYMADAVPGSRLTFVPGEGHLSILCNHAEEIVKALARDVAMYDAGSSH